MQPLEPFQYTEIKGPELAIYSYSYNDLVHLYNS